MRSKPRKHRVTHAGRRITIYRWKHPVTGKAGWRFVWRDAADKRRYITKETLGDAEAEAKSKLEALDEGDSDWQALPPARKRWLQEIHGLAGTHPEEERAISDFIRNRRKSSNILTAVARFMAFKIASEGEQTPHLRTVKKVLEAMAGNFSTYTVADIHAAELAAWWETRGTGLSPKRRKEIRGALVAFWNWAKREGIAGTDAVTAADRIPTPKVSSNERRVLDPDELGIILRNIAPEWRVWAVLGAFAGMRPEEIAPSTDKVASKRGLRIEEIDFKFKVVRLPAEVAEGGRRPRIIPLNDACLAGLAWSGIEDGMTGAVCLRNPSDAEELPRIGKLFPEGKWPQDALRHTYGSARNAVLRNLPQVAEEMGNSVAMLNEHYHNPRTKEEGTAWFACRPPYLQSADQTRITAPEPTEKRSSG